jgi:hypothetical protein
MRSQVSGFHATVEEAEKAPPCLQKKKKKKKTNNQCWNDINHINHQLLMISLPLLFS